jgi:hypothetical protein
MMTCETVAHNGRRVHDLTKGAVLLCGLGKVVGFKMRV